MSWCNKNALHAYIPVFMWFFTDTGPFGTGKYNLQDFKTSHLSSESRTENTEYTMTS